MGSFKNREFRDVSNVSDAFDIRDRRNGGGLAQFRLVVRSAYMLEHSPFKRLDEVLFVPEVFDLPEFKNADILAEKLDIRNNMRRKDDRPVLSYAREKVEKIDPLLGVESRRRLVYDERLRVAYDRLRDTGSAEHSAGVFPKLFLFLADETDRFDHGLDLLTALYFVFHPPHNADIVEELDDVEAWHQPRGLGQITERFAEIAFAFFEVDAVDEDRAVGLIHNCGDDPHERRLPRSISPDKSEYPVRYGDIHFVERFLFSPWIYLCEILYFDHKRALL